MSQETNNNENLHEDELVNDENATEGTEPISNDFAPAEQEMSIDEYSSEQTDAVKDKPKRKIKNIKISLRAYLLSTIAIILATLMLTYTVCSGIYKKKIALPYGDEPEQAYSENDVIDFLLSEYFYGEVDKSKLTAESLKAYVAATDDIYASYYTQDEIEASYEEGAGRTQGIGVNVINSTVDANGNNIAVIKIINVVKNSPAAEKGLRVGDLIVYAGAGEGRESVDYLGYDEALRRLRGEEGTVAEFVVWRAKDNAEGYDEIEFKIPRRVVTAQSVYSHVYSLDGKIGIVKISGFELNTPAQFKEAMEDLKSKGCERFVLDVRNNPGGYLPSIAAVLSCFLNEGDVYIRTEDKNGNIEEEKVGIVEYDSEDYKPCNVTKEDIGRYKELDIVVLCNQNTASAAELFTATFRDYNLGSIVGMTTFGKGKMQTTFSLARFGLEGAVKFTTHMYYSAKSDGYDGIGIKPDDGCEVELSAEAKQYNSYEIPDEKDNQLAEAVKHFK